MDFQERARRAAEARWLGGDLEPGQVERVSRAVFAAWCARANLDLARPGREDVLVDEFVSDAELGWIVPVQLKGVARDGMTVASQYLGFPGSLVWVFLGREDGGLHTRPTTTMVVLDPETAWELPARLGLAHDPRNAASYRWPSITKALRATLKPATATNPGELRDLLQQHAWQPLAESEAMKTFQDEHGSVWQYDETTELGSGGFGAVHPGTNSDGRDIAVKIVSPNGDRAIERLRDREIKIGRLLAEAGHLEHVVPPLGFARQGDQLLIVMERGDIPLHKYLKQNAIDVAEAIQILRDIALGLTELAALGIQHRDLKPRNILRFANGWRLADFGISRDLAEQTANPTFKGWGTWEYIAPEVIDLKPATPQSDLYSLGIIGYELLVGHCPFEGDTDAVLEQHRKIEAPDLPAHVPAPLKRIIARLLRKTPSDRYQDARAVVEALDRVRLPLSPVQVQLSQSGLDVVKRDAAAEAAWQAQLDLYRQFRARQAQGESDLRDLVEEAVELANEALDNEVRFEGGNTRAWEIRWGQQLLSIQFGFSPRMPPTVDYPIVAAVATAHNPQIGNTDKAPLANFIFTHDGSLGTWTARTWSAVGTETRVGHRLAPLWEIFDGRAKEHFTYHDEQLTPELIVGLLDTVLATTC